VKHWRVYAEEGLARCEVAVWLGDGEMAVKYGGQTLSRYDVSLSQDAAKLKAVTNPRLFATPYRTPRSRSSSRSTPSARGAGSRRSGSRGTPPARRRPEALQQALFPYLEAL
jgi:hypothetical protein